MHLADYGPSVDVDRTGRYLSTGPGRVVLEDREDLAREPDQSGRRPVVRGARRHSVLLDLYGRGTIQQTEFRTALRFVDDLCLAAGSSSRSSVGSVRSPSPSQAEPQRVQLDALRRVRRIAELLRAHGDGVFWWVVVEDRGLRDYETRYGIRHGRAVAWLHDAIGAVERVYNPPGKGRAML